MARPPSPGPVPPVVVLFLLLPALLLRVGDSLTTEGRFMNNCIQARRKCQANPTCSAAYHHLDSCIYSVSTPSPSKEPAECLEAAQQLRNSSLMGCSCNRRMKNQAICLSIYWTVHNVRSLDSDLCLKFTMLCTVNAKCDRLRKAYGEACSGPHCQHHVCREQLRAFFEKAPEPLAQGLLLCPCAPGDRGCGERRRNTIAPSCALPSEVPNCLELRRTCLSEPLCRSRLADFQTHCHPLDILRTCETEQSRCLRAYMGMIGTAMTPNFVSDINTSVTLSCTCRGSGNLQEECERLEGSFSHNSCLKEAIAAKMHFHSQLLSNDGTGLTYSVMKHQNKNPAQRPQPWVPSLFSCTLLLTLLLRSW
ncbi:PREDICTED: GDNF family receptor alpha-3 [Chrysochloris asiatica]|uniref:GDNF family receptor alpha-3 n=1 Tax=Chrysochloris asiatica TaxID=185453 RepID=A0A9B0WSG4_CHRAS|nr:PREDICTED: GDNF family receptor alpha-3 [Chrysochloris asiatica]